MQIPLIAGRRRRRRGGGNLSLSLPPATKFSAGLCRFPKKKKERLPAAPVLLPDRRQNGAVKLVPTTTITPPPLSFHSVNPPLPIIHPTPVSQSPKAPLKTASPPPINCPPGGGGVLASIAGAVLVSGRKPRACIATAGAESTPSPPPQKKQQGHGIRQLVQ